MQDLARYAKNILGIRLTPWQLSAFEKYEQELLQWNEKMNLTAIREPEQIRIKHFLDALTCISAMRETPPGRLIDIGTGAGFPGIPLKIIYPSMQLTLVESIGKKASFCSHVAKTLGLENVTVIHARAEVVGRMSEHRQQYDWATARAVAVLPVLVEYLLPFVKVNGAALAMKGENAPAEAHQAEHATRLLGGHLRRLIPVSLPGVVEERYLVIIDKIVATPDLYPRRAGVPSKTPLIRNQKPDPR
jgi:16S rRNA (guanine527-N7)-methyltransferase